MFYIFKKPKCSHSILSPITIKIIPPVNSALFCNLSPNLLPILTPKNDNAKVLEALGKKTTTKSLSALGQKLKYCDLKKLKYGYKNYCIRLVQLVLYKQGLFRKDHLNNVYDKYTASAIKNFQKRYQKQYNLKPTGKMSQATLNVMCWV